MHTWIAGSTCAAAVLSMAVVAAQTYPQTSDKQPTTESTPSSTSSGQSDTTRRGTTGTASSTSSTPQRVTMTGCLMRGTDTRTESWMLSNATMANSTASGRVSENVGTTNESTAGTSRSGSPSNEGTSAGNRNGTATTRAAGSTSTAGGTSGPPKPPRALGNQAPRPGT